MNDIFILPLTNVTIPCIVDLSNRERLLKFRWRYDRHNGYVSTHVSKKGYGRHIYLHNFILGLRRGGDHKNRNKLDCRESNLRRSTYTQNNMNKAKVNGGSRFKGVYRNDRNNCWIAQIKIPDKGIKYLGSFLDEIEAAKIYNLNAKLYYGEFAFLNETDNLEIKVA